MSREVGTSAGSARPLLIGGCLGALLFPIGLAVAIALIFGSASACEPTHGPALKGVPVRLVPIYRRASAAYGLGVRGPATLAAINWVETSFGANLGVSSAAAEGWMQFLPSSWAAYGVDANGDGVKDPYSPADAIFAAARLLRASGAPRNWHDAIFAYNHAEWYVAKVRAAAKRFSGALEGAAPPGRGGGCVAVLSGSPAPEGALRLYAPRAFEPIPARLWVGGGPPQSVDARIWPGAVWLLETFSLRVSAAREPGHKTHGDGTALDMVPAVGRGWDATALRAALALGWIPRCGASGTAPICPLTPAIQFVGYNGYPGHGDPAHAGSGAHLHVSWKSSSYGCPKLCVPRDWVEAFAPRR